MTQTKLNTKQLIARIAFEASTTKENVRAVLGSLNDVTRAALHHGNSVTIPGLVRLTPKTRAARPGRNLATGEAMTIPEKRVVVAKPMPSIQPVQE